MSRFLPSAALLIMLETGVGCGPTNEPARFTPHSAGDPAGSSPTAGGSIPSERSRPARNIEMH